MHPINSHNLASLIELKVTFCVFMSVVDPQKENMAHSFPIFIKQAKYLVKLYVQYSWKL